MEWEGRFVDIRKGESHTPEYLRLNPRGVVPTLVHDDNVVCESNVICEYVNDAFSGPDLTPVSATERAAMRGWYKRLDDHLHFPVTVTLTFAVARMPGLPGGFPRHLPGSAMAADDVPLSDGPLDSLLADSNISATALVACVRAFDRTLGDMQAKLDDSSWLAGDTYSLADIAFAPYITRLDCLALDWLWEDRPNVGGWFERIRARPAYRTAIADWLKPTQAIDAMRANGTAVRDELRELAFS